MNSSSLQYSKFSSSVKNEAKKECSPLRNTTCGELYESIARN